MRINRTRLLWAMALLTVIAAVFVGSKKTETLNHLQCQGEVNLTGNGAVSTILMSISFQDGKGRYDLTSRVTTGKNIENLHNVVLFNYLYEDDAIVMVSENDNALSEIVKERANVPDFFLYRGRGITLKPYKINDNSYIFTEDDTPIFYCKKVQG